MVGIFNPELAGVWVSVCTGLKVSGQEKLKAIWYQPQPWQTGSKKHIEAVLLSTSNNQLWLRDKGKKKQPKIQKPKQQNRLVCQSSISYHISILCSSLDLFLKHMLPQHDRAPDLPDPKPCAGRDLQLQDGSSGLSRLQFSFSAAAGAELQLGCTAAAWKQGWRHWKGVLHCLERIKTFPGKSGPWTGPMSTDWQCCSFL